MFLFKEEDLVKKCGKLLCNNRTGKGLTDHKLISKIFIDNTIDFRI